METKYIRKNPYPCAVATFSPIRLSAAKPAPPSDHSPIGIALTISDGFDQTDRAQSQDLLQGVEAVDVMVVGSDGVPRVKTTQGVNQKPINQA